MPANSPEDREAIRDDPGNEIDRGLHTEISLFGNPFGIQAEQYGPGGFHGIGQFLQAVGGK
jgi:hypothetical protein